MANNAYYRAHIKGDESNVKEFIRAMKWEGEYAENGAGRIFSCYVIDECVLWSDANHAYFCDMEGDVAWSILSALRKEYNPNNIEELSKRLNLVIEMFSQEPGMGFMEHFVVDNGKVLCDDCFDYCEYDIDKFEENMDDIGDEFWEQDFVKESGITRENYIEFANDGYIEIGGCPMDWEYV